MPARLLLTRGSSCGKAGPLFGAIDYITIFLRRSGAAAGASAPNCGNNVLPGVRRLAAQGFGSRREGIIPYSNAELQMCADKSLFRDFLLTGLELFAKMIQKYIINEILKAA